MVRQSRNDFFKPTILPKNQRTNSTLLLWYLGSTCFCSFFGRNWRHQKKHLEINWPLVFSFILSTVSVMFLAPNPWRRHYWDCHSFRFFSWNWLCYVVSIQKPDNLYIMENFRGKVYDFWFILKPNLCM